MAYKAILVGASGLIGSKLLNILLDSSAYDEVVIIVRSSTGLKHQKLRELTIDFDQLENYADEINGHAIFSCLGTTNKKTPDKNLYKIIDHDYPVKLAQLGLKNGIALFNLVSSIGANGKSASFYLKIKGETEEDVKKSGVKTINIYQPSQITGDRKEFRLLERFSIIIMYAINPLLLGKFRKYRSIPAYTIAKAMYKVSLNNNEGCFVYPSDKIKELA